MMWVIFFLGVFLSMVSVKNSWACTTVLVGKAVSETGEVLVGHNEDSSGRYDMRTHIVPARTLSRPATVRFESEAATLELPRRRARLFWSEARSFVPDGGSSFCDFYVNGNGVVVCSDNCGASREDAPELTEGGIGYGVRRVVAESAENAYHAVEIATGLVDRYGYIGSGRSYHFADKNEIWVLQVVRGKHYAVKRVMDDEVYLNPNHYTIRRPDPGTPGVERLVAYAEERGWYEPDRDGAFDFAKTYQAPEGWRSERNVHRHLRGLEIILGTALDTDMDLPFSVKPSRKIGVEDLKKVLRCHFEGTPDDVSNGDGPHSMPTRPICFRSTLESTIVQIRKDNDWTLIRRAQGRPCLAPYVSWYFGVSAVPAPFSGGDPEEALLTHFSVPAPDLNYSDTSAWRGCTDLQTAVELTYREEADKVRAALAEFEKAQEEERTQTELRVAECLSADEDDARVLDEAVARWGAQVVQKMKELYSSLRVLPLALPEKISVGGVSADAPLAVRIPLADAEGSSVGLDPENIALDKTFLGPSQAPADKWSAALKLSRTADGAEILFGGAEWLKNCVPCLTDIWLVTEDVEGRRVIGKGVTRLTQ